MSRLFSALKSPWTVGFSVFGLAYGGYNIIDMSQSGKRYELEADLTGKTYIITGATSGIGRELAQKLAERNARVIMACRNRDKCLEIRRDIVLQSRNKQVFCRMCDLSDFESVQNFVAKLCKGKFEIDRVDGVVNNAAEMLPKRTILPNGIEKSLATNHLGTFLLNGLLLEKLLKQDHPSKIVFVNSNIAAKDNYELNLDKLNAADEKEKYDGFEVYKASKVADLLFAKELAERLKESNITVLATDPGRTKSALNSKMPYQNFFLSRWVMNVVSFFMGQRKTVKACRPVLYAVADPETADKNAVFYDRERHEQRWGANAENAELRRRVWLMSELWTDFKSRLQKLNEQTELLDDGKTANSGGNKTGESQRSWKWLWLR